MVSPHNVDFTSYLPQDLVFETFKYLDYFAVSAVSKKWREIACNPRLKEWRNLCVSNVLLENYKCDIYAKKILKGISSPIHSALIHKDRIFLGKESGRIDIWNLVTGLFERRIQTGQYKVLCLGFLEKTNQLVSAGADCSIKFYNMETGLCEDILKKRDSSHLISMELSSDYKKIYASYLPSCFGFWDLKTKNFTKLYVDSKKIDTTVLIDKDLVFLLHVLGTSTVFNLEKQTTANALKNLDFKRNVSLKKGAPSKLLYFDHQGNLSLYDITKEKPLEFTVKISENEKDEILFASRSQLIILNPETKELEIRDYFKNKC